MLFLANFNFSFSGLPKLASSHPGRKKLQMAADRGTECAATSATDQAGSARHQLSVGECYFDLALAVLSTCPSGPGVARALCTPQLLPLALQQLTSVGSRAQLAMCNTIAQRVFAQGIVHAPFIATHA
jgi:hypothetical protein